MLIRHGDDPPDDRVHAFLLARGLRPELRKPFAGDSLELPDERLAGAVIYGGRFPAFETDLYPFLRAEDRFIGRCIDLGIPLLGICQGAQQIAFHLGATVGPPESGASEFGYYEIAPTAQAGDFLAAPLTVCQSHFHTFSVPDGATRLASSAAFENQAFRYGQKTFGLQFHPEVTVEGFRRWQAAPGARYGMPGAQTREEQDVLMHRHDAAQAAWFHGFLTGFFAEEPETPA